MKVLMFTSLVATQLFAFTFLAEGFTLGQSNVRKIEFAKLSEYVNDFGSRRDGERLVVAGVPSFDAANDGRTNANPSAPADPRNCRRDTAILVFMGSPQADFDARATARTIRS